MLSRTRRAVRAGVMSLSAAALSLTLLVPMQALADPPLTVDEAKAQVEQLTTEAAEIDQQYAAVQDTLTKDKAALKVKEADVLAQIAKVEKMKAQVGQVALAQYQNRSIDRTAQLFLTQDTDGFLSRISTVEKVSENQNTILQDFQSEQANLADLQRSAESDVADLKEQEAELKKLREKSDKKVEESKAVLGRLTAEERRRLAAEEAKREAEAKKAAEAGQTGTNNSGDNKADPKSTDDSDDDSGSTTTSGSGRGATALAFARQQLGEPYAFGGMGPNSWDCSGLTGAAWRAAGVSLPRTSQTQYNVGKPVAKSDLQPGDLVFFYGGLSHVALYAGNGMVLHASRPGKPVAYQKMSYMPYVGARRPG